VVSRVGRQPLRTPRACAVGFPPISIETEDGFAELVAFDGEFGGLSDGAAEGPVAAAGPDGDDGSVWGYAFFQPVSAAVAERCCS